MDSDIVEVVEKRNPHLKRCPECGGSGYGPDSWEYSLECCRNVLPTGECCSALYGGAYLVPVPYPIPTQCPRCMGYGEINGN